MIKAILCPAMILGSHEEISTSLLNPPKQFGVILTMAFDLWKWIYEDYLLLKEFYIFCLWTQLELASDYLNIVPSGKMQKD